MGDYRMLADGDRVLVAVSGGIDSLVLAKVLSLWLNKAPVSYKVHALHVDMEGENPPPGNVACEIVTSLGEISVSCTILEARYIPNREISHRNRKREDKENINAKNICFQCARSRRSQLFDYAREHGFNKLALGHHRDDLIETFFLNMFYGGNISTMVPKQVLFSGDLSIIRPLAYLDKEEVEVIGREYSLVPVRSCCPLEERTKRVAVREILANICHQVPDVKKQIFAAMGNVRCEYLLNPYEK